MKSCITIFKLTILFFSLLTFSQEQAKVVLVTGGFRGLGESIGRYLLDQKYQVVFAGRNLKDRDNLLDLKSNSNSMFLEMDIGDEHSVENGVNQIIEKFGRIDAIIHNAAQVVVKSSIDGSNESLESVLKSNFLGPVALTKKVIPHFEKQKFGRIIYLSSSSSLLREPGFSSYTASKNAAESYFETMSNEMGSTARFINKDIEVSILRLSFVKSKYDPVVYFMEDFAADEEIELQRRFMKWLRDHSTTTEELIGKKISQTINQKNNPVITNLGWDGFMMKVFSTLPRSIQLTCPTFFKRVLKVIGEI